MQDTARFLPTFHTWGGVLPNKADHPTDWILSQTLIVLGYFFNILPKNIVFHKTI